MRCGASPLFHAAEGPEVYNDLSLVQNVSPLKKFDQTRGGGPRSSGRNGLRIK